MIQLLISGSDLTHWLSLRNNRSNPPRAHIPPTHTLYSSAMTDCFLSEQSAARHFELAFSPQPMTKWECYASWSLPNLTPTPLEWRHFILWLAGLSLSWRFACYGSVKRTETARAGGWMSARRPVWGRVESCRFCWICLWSLVKGQEVTHCWEPSGLFFLYVLKVWSS